MAALRIAAARQHRQAEQQHTGSSNIPSSSPALKPSALSGNMLTGQQGFKSSNKSNNTSSSALPSDTNPSTGKKVLNNWLRSIIMSREAFSLFHGFNPNNSSFFSIKEAIVAKKPTVTGPKFMEEATQEEKDLVKDVYDSFSKRKKKLVAETEMTKGMAAKLEAIGSGSGDFSATPELGLENGGDPRSYSRIDIAFGKEDTDGAEGKTLTGFIEVGCLLAKTSEVAMIVCSGTKFTRWSTIFSIWLTLRSSRRGSL